MGELQTFRIVVASPGDVAPERRKLDDVVAELNRSVAPILGSRLEISMWEQNSFPGFHASGPQGLIDSILGIDDCDLFVGIFWKRFGTPVDDAGSGTEHEFHLAYESWKRSQRPQILFYFKNRLIPTDADTDQLRQVQNFKERFPKEGLYWNFRTPAEFERLVRSHLTRALQHLSARPEQDVEPPRQLDAAGPREWHARLMEGSVGLEFDPRARGDVYSFVSVVKEVLAAKGFSPRAFDRVAIVLGELLANVERHVPGSTAWVALELEPTYFRSVRIAVCDSGPGIDAGAAVDYRPLAAGEPEHGLLKILRLANPTLDEPRGRPRDHDHCVVCDVYDPPQPTSVLFDCPFVAPVRMEYEFPKLFWIGRDDVYVESAWHFQTFVDTVATAAEQGWRRVLELYFGPLSSMNARFLGVELTGRKIVTEVPPSSFEKLQTALETYFLRHFEERRVILFAHDTDYAVLSDAGKWAARWNLDYFEDEAACRKRLEELETGAS